MMVSMTKDSKTTATLAETRQILRHSSDEPLGRHFVRVELNGFNGKRGFRVEGRGPLLAR